MSSRQLRKLQKQQELQKLEAQNAAEDDESSEDERPAQKPKPSLFSGFATLEDQEEEEEEDDDVENKEEDLGEATKKDATEPDPTEAIADTSKTSTSKKSKNKKKKKKAKKQDVAQSTVGKTSHSEQDEIDQALRELNLKQPMKKSQEHHSSMKAFERICELLSINTNHLKVINEMRNLFGREAMAAANTEEEQGPVNPRHRQTETIDLETFLKGKPGTSLSQVTLRRNPFLAGKESWPNATTEGLTMEQVKEESEGDFPSMPGTTEFRFVHDNKYNMLEEQFWEAIQMFEPQVIIIFLHDHPYHISSLIQVSRIAKQDQNAALSADLCERALFTFGRISLSAFRQKLEQGKARLSFKRPENRQFWLAGYHYLKNLIMKGTYRTALEWCKLLLSIDHLDPYGIIHFIHPLAIRAHESQWFIDLCDSGILEVDPHGQSAPDYIRQTLVLARLQQKDIAGAKALLMGGMERLPWLYGQLFKSLNLDVPKSLWGWQPRNQEEDLHTNVYIHQTKGLWDNAQATSLLKEVGNEVKKANSDSATPYESRPLVKTNFGRFVYLLEVPSLISLIPRGLLNTNANWEFDPLPPPLQENIFSHSSQTRPWIPGGGNTQSRTRPNFDDLMHHFLDVRRDGFEADIESDDGREYEGYDADEVPNSRTRMTRIGEAIQTFWDNLLPDLDNANSDEGGTGDHRIVLRGMPGVWQDTDAEDESSEDEMPPLVADGDLNNANNHNGDDGDSDNEMPPLIPDVGRNGGN